MPIGSLAFSPDGKVLAVGAGLTIDAYSSVEALKLWRLNDLNMLSAALPGLRPIRQISWSNEAQFLAVAAGDKTVRLCTLATDPKARWISLPFHKRVLSLGFSPSENVLAVASGAMVQTLTVLNPYK